MSKKYTKNPYDQSNFTVNPILTKFCHYNQKGFLEGSCKFWFIIWNFFLKNLFQIFQLSGIFFCENNLECCSKEKLFFGIKTYFFKKNKLLVASNLIVNSTISVCFLSQSSSSWQKGIQKTGSNRIAASLRIALGQILQNVLLCHSKKALKLHLVLMH